MAEQMARQRGTRNVERSAIWAFVPVAAMAPFCLLALAIIWFPFMLVIDVKYWWAVAAFLAIGLLLFVRPFQAFVLTPILGARLPTSDEAERIGPVWREIALANNLPPTRYILRVLPSEDLNAFACGGHLVVVTSFAAHELSPTQLRGVLAHELSHHLGSRTVAATMIRGLSWVFTAALRGGDALANYVGHASEFEADKRAVKMGYGPELASALRHVLATGTAGRPIGWRARLAASHPAARTRVARIEALQRHPAG